MVGNPASGTDRDRAAFVDALRALERALEQNQQRTQRMKARIDQLVEACETGQPISEIVPQESTPLTVQLLTESVQALNEYGGELRRTEAQVLHREGMTMGQIAELFGVTRQRISALLRER